MPFLQCQMMVAKLILAYNSLIIGPRDLGYESNLQEIMDLESFDVVRLSLGPSFKVKRGYAN